LTSNPDERAVGAIESAVCEARRLNGLMDPERRPRYNYPGPDPELSPDEHAEIETIFRAWLLDAIREFSPNEPGQ
jgi:hypothetical protein